MRFQKETFLNSILGNKLQIIIEYWNTAIYEKNDTEITQYKAQWSVFKDMFQQFYNKNCEIEKNKDFFGVVIKGKKESEWLIKLNRKGIIQDRHYTNRNNECECYLCEYENICQVANKSQRLSRQKSITGLGECWKLQKE